MPAGWTGELLPMLGPGASLSAGIAIGHYKTPLSVLLQRSKELLDFSKTEGRSRIGFGHASRGGEKSRFTLPWNINGEQAHNIIKQVIDSFHSENLPFRLPYKLRSLSSALHPILEDLKLGKLKEKEFDELCRGLFLSCLGEGDFKDQEAYQQVQAAQRLWLEGVKLFQEDYERITDGLLFCRTMAHLGDEE